MSGVSCPGDESDGLRESGDATYPVFTLDVADVSYVNALDVGETVNYGGRVWAVRVASTKLIFLDVGNTEESKIQVMLSGPVAETSTARIGDWIYVFGEMFRPFFKPGSKLPPLGIKARCVRVEATALRVFPKVTRDPPPPPPSSPLNLLYG
jgi:hypothetical protein